VLVVATTPAVRSDLLACFPGLPTTVATFSLTDPAARLTGSERTKARRALDIGTGETVAVMVGGWWPGKHPAVVADALHLLVPDEVPSGGLRLVVAGHPLDEPVLARMASAPSVRLTTYHRVLSNDELRTLYAAADLALVSRTADCLKESALVADAVRLGVPLLVSDHDPDLTTRLAGTRWAAVFHSGDAANLAAVLRRVLAAPVHRPGPDAAATIGLVTGPRALARYIHLFERIGGHS
jgi:glycosyltransferase involved in cell wall biosynthesis